MNISKLKKLDAVIGTLGVSALPCPDRNVILSDIRSILIIRPGGMGDAILLAPIIISIKKFYPDVRITILAECRNAGVFPLVPEVDEVLRYDCPRELIQALLCRFDVVIDTEQWYRLSAVVARLLRAPIKIGFGTNERRRMFTHSMDYDLALYEPENFAALLKPLGVSWQPDGGTVCLSVPLQAVTRADRLLQALCSEPYIVISPGASTPEKRWGAKRFSTVARRLVENGYGVVVVGGTEDRVEGESIAEAGGLNLAGLTTMSESAAVIASSRLVICGDSGVLHLAAGLGVSTVSLFGPSCTVKWAPRGERHTVLDKRLLCSPCSRFGTIPRCPRLTECLSAISPEEVVSAVLTLLLGRENNSLDNFSPD